MASYCRYFHITIRLVFYPHQHISAAISQMFYCSSRQIDHLISLLLHKPFKLHYWEAIFTGSKSLRPMTQKTGYKK